MSDKPVSPTVSALRQVLANSAAITEQLDLKQGEWWEYTGFDKVAKALQAEYQVLVGLRTDIRAILEPIPNDLRGDTATKLGKLVETFGKVEAQMLILERQQVDNKTEARNKHKDLVTAQIKIAAPLKQQIADAVKTAVAETDAINTDEALQAAVKVDQTKVKGLNDRMAALLLLDIGAAVPTSPKKLQSNLRQCDERLATIKKPLTPKQHEALSGFGALELEYTKAAAAETERKRKEVEAEAERKVKQKAIDDWAAALKSAKAEIDNWKNNAEIAEARTILFTLQPFTKNGLALDKAIKEFPAFDPATPKTDQLTLALAAVTTAGALLVAPARDAVAARDANVRDAVATVTDTVTNVKKKPAGTEPFENDLKAAVAKIPGLIEEVRALYRSANHTKPPQVKRRDDRQASLQGEADKYTRIGGWLNVCGLSGAPRTGPNGPVFMNNATSLIDGFTTHISQYQANATLPVDGLNSSLGDAMAALFGATGPLTGPHITLELVADFGSASNARLYYHSGRFRAGDIPDKDLASYEAKMRAQLDHAMSVFRKRIADVLA